MVALAILRYFKLVHILTMAISVSYNFPEMVSDVISDSLSIGKKFRILPASATVMFKTSSFDIPAKLIVNATNNAKYFCFIVCIFQKKSSSSFTERVKPYFAYSSIIEANSFFINSFFESGTLHSISMCVKRASSLNA